MSDIAAQPAPHRSDMARPIQLKFEIGARTLMAIQRSLVRIPQSLEDARAGMLPELPALERDAHGYAITSLPETLQSMMVSASGDMLPFVRQRYTRYFIDFSVGFEGWWNGLSANARQGLKRKAKKIAAESGGDLDVRSFSRPSELDEFHDVARRISLRTYQERLLGSGLPDSPEFLREMVAMSAQDRVRAWLLYIAGEPAAYLYCPIVGDNVIYAHVGHDPAFNDLSPGAVLQLEAMRDLFDENRFARFDFTEGEGQHKRQFATGGVPCIDLLLLRPSLANRVTMAALGGFNRGVALVKRGVNAAGLGKLAKKVRRGG
ncbi:MAG: GNAT family N-acetyltransferase [Sphingomonas sp.]|uniref:GNAT family N-acetyltransferase n=1 Tax=Sphingomonas sp. TaxID=28214 RepID=UPI0025D942F4|nr:GNAT family N-acetyltransferase [Sphingomonas sp.]MBX3566168.1 GNAT family N-acetyltransferase [Sphingomonas sp.]